MISAVTAQGALRFSLHRQLHRRAVHRLLPAAAARQPRAGLPGRRRPPHPPRSGHNEFVASTDGRLKLFVLPAYSPSSTPTSGSGRTSSTTASATSVTGQDEFKAKVIGALRRLQKLPALVRGFFADPGLRYITA